MNPWSSVSHSVALDTTLAGVLRQEGRGWGRPHRLHHRACSEGKGGPWTSGRGIYPRSQVENSAAQESVREGD